MERKVWQLYKFVTYPGECPAAQRKYRRWVADFQSLEAAMKRGKRLQEDHTILECMHDGLHPALIPTDAMRFDARGNLRHVEGI